MKKLGILLFLVFIGAACSMTTPLSKTNSKWEITSNPYPEFRFYNQPQHGVYTMTWYEDGVLNVRYFRY